MKKHLFLLLLSMLVCAASLALADEYAFSPDGTALDLGERILSMEELTALLDAHPALTRVDMFATTVEKPQIEYLSARYPGITFGWTIHIPGRFEGHTVRTDQTAFSTLHGNCFTHTSGDFEVLKYCTELRALDLGHNVVEDLSFLRNLRQLRVLILACNRVSDLSPLRDLRNLEYIELFSNPITDLSPLYDLPHLMDINVAYLDLADPETLTHFPAARRLWVSRCMSGHRNLRRSDLKELQALYPDASLCFQGEPTEGGWRRHPHYEVMKESFLSGTYIPFADSFPEEAPAVSTVLRSGLIISEVLTGNFQGCAADGARGLDVVEILNAGPETVQLADFRLSDSKKKLGRYALPSGKLAPGQYTLVFCDGLGQKGRAPFKLSSAGETLYLSDAAGNLVDSLKIPALPVDVSYGRDSHGQDRYFSAFTPRESNGPGFSRVAEKPAFSVPSGGYAQPLTVSVTGEEPIYYTLDGSVPTASSLLYEGPISVSGTTCLRAVSLPPDALASEAAAALYRFDSAYALPSLTVSLPAPSFSGSSWALLAHPLEKGYAVPAVATMINPDGSLLFSAGCGLGISGQTTRERKYCGWKLKFKSMYGGMPSAKIFPDSDQNRFDSLNLRVGSVFNPTHDVLGTLLGAEEMPAVLCQHARPVNLWINEAFYGVYYLRENINPRFVASTLGGSEDEVDIIYRAYEVEEGSGEDWTALNRFCREHDLRDAENYAYVCSQVNPDSFIDYYIWRAYTGDTDYPNFRVTRCRDAADSRWHLIMYDLDWAFRMKNEEKISLTYYAYTPYDSATHNNLILTSLLENADFRQAFLSRLAYHLRVTFDPARVSALLDQVLAEVMPDMPATWAARKASSQKWLADAEEIRRFIGSGATDRRLRLVRETVDFFHLSDQEALSLFGDLYRGSL